MNTTYLFCAIILIILEPIAQGDSGDEDETKVAVLRRTTFVILSQPDKFHSKMSHAAKKRLRSSLDKYKSLKAVQIILSHEDLSYHGSWTIFPIISQLGNRLKQEAQWCVFLDSASVVQVENLARVLMKNAPEHFLGYRLEDKIHNIIHHFKDPHELGYPNFEAGFILSGAIIRQMSSSMAEYGKSLDWLPDTFSIDAQYELAQAIKSQDRRNVLKHEPLLCLSYNETCAIYPQSDVNDCDSTEETVLKLSRETLFAVKTCKKYHEERLPVIQKTWAEAALNVMYFSEVTDSHWNTLQLEGVENTDSGHCGKTMAIVKYFAENAAKKGIM